MFIDRGSGVVIGETAVLGDNVTLYQDVALRGTGKNTGKRHPTLEDNVTASAGTKVIGAVTIEKNFQIGAGAVVLRDVPLNSTVTGVSGRVVKQNGGRTPHQYRDCRAVQKGGRKENIA